MTSRRAHGRNMAKPWVLQFEAMISEYRKQNTYRVLLRLRGCRKKTAFAVFEYKGRRFSDS
jgi:hypothetical protein